MLGLEEENYIYFEWLEFMKQIKPFYLSSLTSHCAVLQTPILYNSHLKLSQFWFWLEIFNLKQIKSKGTPWQAVVPLPFLSSAAIATISPWNATEPRPQYTAPAKIQFQNQLQHWNCALGGVCKSLRLAICWNSSTNTLHQTQTYPDLVSFVTNPNKIFVRKFQF